MAGVPPFHRFTRCWSVPRDRWLAMGPGARKGAEAHLVVRLRKDVEGQGLELAGEPVVGVRVDEAERRVLLLADAKAVPRTS
jgi:hypothetical protein